MDNNIYYTDCHIYGIKIYSYSYIHDYVLLFEQKYNTIMSKEMMEESRVFYNNLDEHNKKNVKFQIYIKCKSIDDEKKCMIWLNTSLNEFIKEFDV